MTTEGKMMAASIDAAGEGLRVGAPQILFQSDIVRTIASYWEYDVAGDGKRFLINAGLAQASRTATLYSNWPAALKK